MGRQRSMEPQQNDWLFSCPEKMKTRQLIIALNAEGQPVTELSARDWSETWRLYNDFIYAYRYPEKYLLHAKDTISWDGLADLIFAKCWEGRVFRGELLLIRECHPNLLKSLAFIVHITKDHIQHIEQLRFQGRIPMQSKAKLLLVLEDWKEPAFIYRKLSLQVNKVRLSSILGDV